MQLKHGLSEEGMHSRKNVPATERKIVKPILHWSISGYNIATRFTLNWSTNVFCQSEEWF